MIKDTVGQKFHRRIFVKLLNGCMNTALEIRCILVAADNCHDAGFVHGLSKFFHQYTSELSIIWPIICKSFAFWCISVETNNLGTKTDSIINSRSKNICIAASNSNSCCTWVAQSINCLSLFLRIFSLRGLPVNNDFHTILGTNFFCSYTGASICGNKHWIRFALSDQSNCDTLPGHFLIISLSYYYTRAYK